MTAKAKHEVKLILPMLPDMELVAAQTAESLAQLMDFELQLALIETCINAFEHSKSKDQRVLITFILRDDALELKITDRGTGFQPKQVALHPRSLFSGVAPSKARADGGMRKRDVNRSQLVVLGIEGKGRMEGWKIASFPSSFLPFFLASFFAVQSGKRGTTITIIKRKKK